MAGVKRTEADMLGLLRARHNENGGNGRAFAFIDHVRDAAGFEAGRTIDAIAMGLWPSRGLMIDAFEIKCSRSDWLRELKEPAKADGFCERVDRFWLVLSDEAIIRDGELPLTWGLLVPKGKGLVVKVPAPLLREQAIVRGRDLPPRFNRSFLAALLRGACYVGTAGPEEIEEARKEGFERAKFVFGSDAERQRDRFEKLAARVKAFEAASGVPIQWGPDATAIGKAVRAVMDSDNYVGQVRTSIEHAASAARRMLKMAEEITTEMEEAVKR